MINDSVEETNPVLVRRLDNILFYLTLLQRYPEPYTCIVTTTFFKPRSILLYCEGGSPDALRGGFPIEKVLGAALLCKEISRYSQLVILQSLENHRTLKEISLEITKSHREILLVPMKLPGKLRYRSGLQTPSTDII